jgi:sulfur relay (sulfurtransferase) complex TusBCD TusD component (DsrE family)
MRGYLLIESRDPFESTGAARTCELAIQLRAAGHDVALFLVQNGVLAVRSGARRTSSTKCSGRRSKCSRTTSRCVSGASLRQA